MSQPLTCRAPAVATVQVDDDKVRARGPPSPFRIRMCTNLTPPSTPHAVVQIKEQKEA